VFINDVLLISPRLILLTRLPYRDAPFYEKWLARFKKCPTPWWTR